MAGTDFIKVDTAQVAAVANNIDTMNTKLYNLLQDSKSTISGLSSTWDGPASQATISAYDAFAKKYFEDYRDLLNAYVLFLRNNVDAGYVATETNVENLAERFK